MEGVVTKTAPDLRPYQKDALEAIWGAYQQGSTRILIQAATGVGKTQIFSGLLQHAGVKAWLQAFPDRQRQMLIVAHREELLDQAARRIEQMNPGVLVSIEQGDRHASPYGDVVIANIQTLAASKGRRLLRLLQRCRFRIVVIDEAHHASAPSYRTMLVRLGFLPPADASDTEDAEAADYDDIAVMNAALAGWEQQAPKDQLLLGVTATPNRSDAIGLGCVFQTLAFTYGTKPAIEDGWLVSIEPWVVETTTDLDAVRVSHGDFNQKDLGVAVNQMARNHLAVAAWLEHAKGLPTLAFTVDVSHAHALAQEFQKAGVRASAISGVTPHEERRQLLADFQARRIDLLANAMLLTEGTDLPLTECILHAKPTKSATLYAQMTGRGLRTSSGKTRCVVIDLVDIARRHSLQAAPVLYGLPPGLKANGDDLRKLEGDLETLRDTYPQFDVEKALAEGHFTLAQLAAQAKTFDIWTVPALGAVGDGLSLSWIKVGEDSYRIQYPWGDGTEILKVEKDMLGHFDVSVTLRSRTLSVSPYRANGASEQVRQRTLAAQVVGAQAALQLAEAFVSSERSSALRLKDKDAGWKKRPASEKQLALLRRRRIPFRPNLTMGEASSLIDLANARRGL